MFKDMVVWEVVARFDWEVNGTGHIGRWQKERFNSLVSLEVLVMVDCEVKVLVI